MERGKPTRWRGLILYETLNGKAVIGDMKCHHKKPREHGGSDAYSNLVWVTANVYKLIHATNPETIAKYLQLIDPTKVP